MREALENCCFYATAYILAPLAGLGITYGISISDLTSASGLTNIWKAVCVVSCVFFYISLRNEKVCLIGVPYVFVLFLGLIADLVLIISGRVTSIGGAIFLALILLWCTITVGSVVLGRSLEYVDLTCDCDPSEYCLEITTATVGTGLTVAIIAMAFWPVCNKAIMFVWIAIAILSFIAYLVGLFKNKQGLRIPLVLVQNSMVIIYLPFQLINLDSYQRKPASDIALMVLTVIFAIILLYCAGLVAEDTMGCCPHEMEHAGGTSGETAPARGVLQITARVTTYRTTTVATV